jgi:vacuolar protein sorting-associated protein 54
MSKPGSGAASGPGTGAAGTPTPVASSPPPSESFFSEMDGTIAGSMLDTSFADVWDAPADAAALNIVSWKLDVNARIEDGVDKRGFNGEWYRPLSVAAGVPC